MPESESSFEAQVGGQLIMAFVQASSEVRQFRDIKELSPFLEAAFAKLLETGGDNPAFVAYYRETIRVIMEARDALDEVEHGPFGEAVRNTDEYRAFAIEAEQAEADRLSSMLRHPAGKGLKDDDADALLKLAAAMGIDISDLTD